MPNTAATPQTWAGRRRAGARPWARLADGVGASPQGAAQPGPTPGGLPDRTDWSAPPTAHARAEQAARERRPRRPTWASDRPPGTTVRSARLKRARAAAEAACRAPTVTPRSPDVRPRTRILAGAPGSSDLRGPHLTSWSPPRPGENRPSPPWAHDTLLPEPGSTRVSTVTTCSVGQAARPVTPERARFAPNVAGRARAFSCSPRSPGTSMVALPVHAVSLLPAVGAAPPGGLRDGRTCRRRCRVDAPGLPAAQPSRPIRDGRTVAGVLQPGAARRCALDQVARRVVGALLATSGTTARLLSTARRPARSLARVACCHLTGGATPGAGRNITSNCVREERRCSAK